MSGSIVKHYIDHDLVFKGTVKKIEKRGGFNVITFKVKEVYKGFKDTKEIKITTYGAHRGGCGLQVKRGSQWLIFAYSKDEKYSTSLCSGNINLKEEDKENNKNVFGTLEQIATSRGHTQWKDGENNIFAEGEFKKGLPEGDWKFFKSNESERGFYKNGLKDSIWEKITANGYKVITNYRKGIRDGNELTFYDTGDLSMQVKYVDNIITDTIYRWYKNGQMESQAIVGNDSVKNHPKGFWNYWDENGNQTIVNGNGVCIRKDEGGNVISKNNFVNGIRGGKQQMYYKNGQLWMEENLENGQIKSASARYENGQMQSVRYYNNNSEEILDTTWYENGQTRSQSMRSNGKLLLINFWSDKGEQMIKNGNGVLLMHNSYDGKIFRKVDYKNGLMDGSEETYNRKGELISVKNYKDGKLQWTKAKTNGIWIKEKPNDA